MIFPDGRRAAAKALGANFSRDSGLAKITEAGKWPHVEMGHSDDIKPGAWCLALGNPGGIQQGRTPPIRLGRVLNAGKDARFLVTDATVISGDSGGPLFDLEGRVIGIHSNIGTNVTQNQHVPIDVYRQQWNDLVAGKTFGTPADLHAGGLPSRDKLRRFQQLLFQKMLAGDPEVRDLVKDGHINLTPQEIDRLLEKWEKPAPKAKPAPAPSGNAANRPLDFLKFQRLFQERLLVGDPEVLKLIKDGKMLLTPEQMHGLMDEWEKRGLAAQTPRPPLIEGMNQRLAEREADYGKSSPSLLRDVAPLAATFAHSTVVVLCDGKPVALGTVVRKNGYILTKASELHGKLACRIGARELPATLVKSKADYDLALLKVDAADLTPLAWPEGQPPVPGILPDHPRRGPRRCGAGRRQRGGPAHPRCAENLAPQPGHRRRCARSDGQGSPRARGLGEPARGQGRLEVGRCHPIR